MMRADRIAVSGAAVIMLVMPALLLAQNGDSFMGRWTGTYRTENAETGPFQVQVVPRGGGGYQLWVRMGERGSRYDVSGHSANQELNFQGRFEFASGTDEAAYDLTGKIAGERMTGRFTSTEASGAIELTKQPLPTLAPGKPPADANVLFGGATLEAWQRADGGAADWPARADGSMETGATDLLTRRSFSGFKLHVEFLLPLQPAARGQQRGNSGVVIGGGCEVHILDSFAQEPGKGSCGAIFGVAAPRVDACHPPLEWQTFDITLRAPAADTAGKQGQSAEITVSLNGAVLHERRALDGCRAAPIRLRSGGSPVRFRNIWLQPLAE